MILLMLVIFVSVFVVCIPMGWICYAIYEVLNVRFTRNRRSEAHSSEAPHSSDPHEAAARALSNNVQQQNEEITNNV